MPLSTETSPLSDQHLAAGGVWYLGLPDPLHGCGSVQWHSMFWARQHVVGPRLAELDVFIGDQGLVTAPHWSRPPMSRLSLEPHELGTPIGFPWYAGLAFWRLLGMWKLEEKDVK